MPQKKQCALTIGELFLSKKYNDVCTKLESSHNLSIIESYLGGVSYLFIEKYNIGLRLIQSLAKHREECPDYNLYLSLAYLKCGHYEKAEKEIRQLKDHESELFYEIRLDCALNNNAYHQSRVPKALTLQLSKEAQSETFIETGTCNGLSTQWASVWFNKVHTIEKSEALYFNQKNRLKQIPGVHLLSWV